MVAAVSAFASGMVFEFFRARLSNGREKRIVVERDWVVESRVV